MAKVYEALKRVEHERSLNEREARNVRHDLPSQSRWRGWFGRGGGLTVAAPPTAAPELLERIDALAGAVESIRGGRDVALGELEPRLEALSSQLRRIEAGVRGLEQRLNHGLGGSVGDVTRRLSQLRTQLLCVAVVAILALCAAFLRG
jgi:hypothetical protein